MLLMIETLFLPGKGSSESSEKGKKGELQIIFRLIQLKSHMHDFNTREQADKQISFSTKLECQIKSNQVRV